jgi:hypothetical protein
LAASPAWRAASSAAAARDAWGREFRRFENQERLARRDRVARRTMTAEIGATMRLEINAVSRAVSVPPASYREIQSTPRLSRWRRERRPRWRPGPSSRRAGDRGHGNQSKGKRFRGHRGPHGVDTGARPMRALQLRARHDQVDECVDSLGLGVDRRRRRGEHVVDTHDAGVVPVADDALALPRLGDEITADVDPGTRRVQVLHGAHDVDLHTASASACAAWAATDCGRGGTPGSGRGPAQ